MGLIEILRDCEADSRFSVVNDKRELLRAKIVYNNASDTNKFKGPVSFGTEVLSSYARGFILKGHVSEQILRRMQGLYSSGILRWHNVFWKKFYEDKGMLQDVPLIRGFQASSLKGSIKVVFIVFPVGFLVAFLCVLIENWKKTGIVCGMGLSGIVKVWNGCCLKLFKK